MMKCSKIQHLFTEYLENSLSEVANSEIEKHINTCNSCKKEFDEMNSFLSDLDHQKTVMPSTKLRTNFEKMLAEEIENSQPKVVDLQPKSDWKSYLRVAASILLVVSAFLLGKYQTITAVVAKNDAQQKTNEVLALLENNSASKRILALDNAKSFTNKDTKIIEALINRLYFDKNTNVRLAAAETLSRFSSEEIVRDALIKALETDKNSSVQIELIQILAKIQEKRAVIPMKEILKSDKTPEYVKQQVQLNLPRFI